MGAVVITYLVHAPKLYAEPRIQSSVELPLIDATNKPGAVGWINGPCAIPPRDPLR